MDSEIVIDQDVKCVLEFMQKNMMANKLVNVAKSVADLAPILWGKYHQEEIFPLLMRSNIKSDYVEQKRSNANV